MIDDSDFIFAQSLRGKKCFCWCHTNTLGTILRRFPHWLVFGGTASVWGGAATRRDLKSDFIHIELNTLYLYSNTWFHVCFYMKVSVSLQSVCGYARWRNFRGSASVEHGRDLNHPQSTQSEGTLWPMSTTFQVGIAQFDLLTLSPCKQSCNRCSGRRAGFLKLGEN